MEMQRVQRCCYDRAAQAIVAPTLVFSLHTCCDHKAKLGNLGTVTGTAYACSVLRVYKFAFFVWCLSN